MPSAIPALVQQMHDAPGMVALVTAGAGTQALAWLLGVAGASRTVLEAYVPYSKTAFDGYIGRVPDKYVSAEATRFLAGNGLRRARTLRPSDTTPVIGLACSATIITDRPKKGEHRAFVAAWSETAVISHELVLAKGLRDRDGEEDVVSRLILNTLAEAMGLADRLPLPLLGQEVVEREVVDLGAAVGRVLARQAQFVGVYADGRVREEGIRPQVLLPGSFNPLHAGHEGLAQATAALLGKPVAMELSLANVDKPPLALAVALGRLGQMAGRWPIYLTHAPTFVEKARLFPGVVFVVGYDTAVRLFSPRYYEGEGVTAVLDELLELGVRFVIAGRTNGEGVFHDAADLSIPVGYDSLFIPLPARKFRLDISSTALRG
jgi:hypothetical protein